MRNTPPSESYLVGPRVRLRALEPEDLEVLYRWENDSSCWEVGSTLEPLSRFALKNYLAEGGDLYLRKQLRLMIVSRRSNRSWGVIDVFDFDPYHGRAAIGILIDASVRGKGIAREALRVLCRYLFGFLRLHQLYAYLPETNRASRQLFARTGFIPAGRLREWIRSGDGFQDVFVVQCRRDDFLSSDRAASDK